VRVSSPRASDLGRPVAANGIQTAILFSLARGAGCRAATPPVARKIHCSGRTDTHPRVPSGTVTRSAALGALRGDGMFLFAFGGEMQIYAGRPGKRGASERFSSSSPRLGRRRRLPGDRAITCRPFWPIRSRKALDSRGRPCSACSRARCCCRLFWARPSAARSTTGAAAACCPASTRARARAREAAGNQRPWPADKVERWSIDRLIAPPSEGRERQGPERQEEPFQMQTLSDREATSPAIRRRQALGGTRTRSGR
jgi:hypothetical protein